MVELREKYRQFRAWQQRPYEVAPLKDESHECATCGTHFEGNYCPRCGMSSSLGRYSAKKAFLLFLDVWGLGNRGMFRSLRDLVLRPGYMIRDYLQGMQMAYFPPFKMFFLLAALSLLVATGMNISGENRFDTVYKNFSQELHDSLEPEAGSLEAPDYKSGAADQQDAAARQEAIARQVSMDTEALSNMVYEWTVKHMSFVSMVLLLLFTGPLYLLFRKAPAYPGMKFSEFFVAMVYTTNMLSVYSIVFNFFCLSPMFEIASYLLAIVPIKQLSGYSYWRTALYILVALIVFAVLFFLLVFLSFAVYGIIHYGTS